MNPEDVNYTDLAHTLNALLRLLSVLDGLFAQDIVNEVALGGRRIDFMKIDVEGAEYNALLGSEGLIRRDRPVIVFEFGPGQMTGISGVTGEVLLAWLIAEGYALEVVQLDGPAVFYGDDVAWIMRCHVARGRDHIDIVARPVSAGGGSKGGSFLRGFFGGGGR